MNSKRFVYLLLTFSILIAVSADCYSIQTGCFSTSQKAQDQVDFWQGKGFSPVRIVEEKGLFKVHVGDFDQYVQASFFLKKMRQEDSLKGCFIRSREDENLRSSVRRSSPKTYSFFTNTQKSVSKKQVSSNKKSSMRSNDEIMAAALEDLSSLELHRRVKLLYLDGDDTALEFLRDQLQLPAYSDGLYQHIQVMLGIRKMSANELSEALILLDQSISREAGSGWGLFGSYQKGVLLIAQDKHEDAMVVFEDMMNIYPEKNIAGKAAIRLGYLRTAQGDPMLARQVFMRVANAEVSASDADRLEAMRYIANALHHQKELSQSFQAFDEMQAFSDDPSEQLRFAVQKAGLALESVLNAKGSYEDCRAICEGILALQNVAPEDLHYQARAALMLVESYHYEEEYQLSLDRISELQSRFSACPLENDCLTFWKGENYMKLGRTTEAFAVFDQLVSAQGGQRKTSSSYEGFKDFDPRLCALCSAYSLEQKTPNRRGKSKASNYRKLILRDYPKSKFAKWLKKK